MGGYKQASGYPKARRREKKESNATFSHRNDVCSPRSKKCNPTENTNEWRMTQPTVCSAASSTRSRNRDCQSQLITSYFLLSSRLQGVFGAPIALIWSINDGLRFFTRDGRTGCQRFNEKAKTHRYRTNLARTPIRLCSRRGDLEHERVSRAWRTLRERHSNLVSRAQARRWHRAATEVCYGARMQWCSVSFAAAPMSNGSRGKVCASCGE